MNLLDRYIFKSVLFTCLGAMSLFAFVLMLVNVVRDLLSYTLAGQLPIAVFGQLVLLILPAVAIYALPMGMLTGVLLTLGRLSADSEITAMRAAGLSMSRIARPVFILAALGSAIALFVNFQSMPRARVQYHHQFAQAIRSNPLRIIVPKTFLHDFKGCVVYVGEKQGAVMRDFWLWQFDNETDRRVRRVVHAESGRFDYDETTNELILVLTRAQVEVRNAKNPEDFSSPPQVASFEQSEAVRFGLESMFGHTTIQQKQDWMTVDELQAERLRLAKLTGTPKEVAKARMKLELIINNKFNLSLAVFVFAMIGVPLGIKVSRRETSANLGVAVLLAVGYYFLIAMVGWLDRHPEYRPDLLLWLPNLVFFCLGLWLLRRIDRR